MAGISIFSYSFRFFHRIKSKIHATACGAFTPACPVFGDPANDPLFEGPGLFEPFGG